jgi:Ca2+-binding EF-hand superfamily protein
VTDKAIKTLVAWHRELPTRDPSQTTDWVREKATAFFDKLDTDKNGEVSFEEFDASVKRGGEGLEWLQSALS